MYDKVIVLEIKEKYALAMLTGGEIVKIKLKEDLEIGDSVYVLPDDIYEEKTVNFTVLKNKSILKSTISIAAVLAICIFIFLMPQSAIETYAVASFDAEQGIQFEIDKNGNILKAVSFDNSWTSEQLALFEGKNLTDVSSDITKMIGDGTFVVGFAFNSQNIDAKKETDIRNIFKDEDIIYFEGTKDDIEMASKHELSVGMYIAGIEASEENWNQMDDLDDLEINELMNLLEKDEKWMSVPEFTQALQEKREELYEEMDDNDEDEDSEKNDITDDLEDDNDDKIDDDLEDNND